MAKLGHTSSDLVFYLLTVCMCPLTPWTLLTCEFFSWDTFLPERFFTCVFFTWDTFYWSVFFTCMFFLHGTFFTGAFFYMGVFYMRHFFTGAFLHVCFFTHEFFYTNMFFFFTGLISSYHTYALLHITRTYQWIYCTGPVLPQDTSKHMNIHVSL